MSMEDKFFARAQQIEDSRIPRGTAICPHCKCAMQKSGEMSAAWHGCSYNLIAIGLFCTIILSPIGLVFAYIGRKSSKEVFWKCPECQYAFQKV